MSKKGLLRRLAESDEPKSTGGSRLGFLGISIPHSDGGTEVNLVTLVSLLEILGGACGSTTLVAVNVRKLSGSDERGRHPARDSARDGGLAVRSVDRLVACRPGERGERCLPPAPVETGPRLAAQKT